MTATITKKTSTRIELEWDNVYGAVGDSVTVEGTDYIVAGITYRGPRESDGVFVTRAHAWSPLYIEIHARTKRANILAGRRAASTETLLAIALSAWFVRELGLRSTTSSLSGTVISRWME